MNNFRATTYAEERLSHLELENGHYLDLISLLSLMPNSRAFSRIINDYTVNFVKAAGSSHNHQAWEGGYLDHIVETMNIACQLYQTLNSARKLPFQLSDALEVMFLHDLEKPFKVGKLLIKTCGCEGDCTNNTIEATKDNRKKFRNDMIAEYEIKLSDDQHNALRYVEGVPDSEYTPGERTMGELAAFCHCCDILSARLWHDKGHDVRTGSTSWE